METFTTIVGYVLVGSLCLILLMLLFALFLHALGYALHIVYYIGLFCISIPAFLFNQKQFIEGFRLGKKFPYASDVAAMKLLEEHSRAATHERK